MWLFWDAAGSAHSNDLEGYFAGEPRDFPVLAIIGAVQNMCRYILHASFTVPMRKMTMPLTIITNVNLPQGKRLIRRATLQPRVLPLPGKQVGLNRDSGRNPKAVSTLSLFRCDRCEPPA